MVHLDKGGVSDIVVIAFMFIFLIVAATILFGFTSNSLEAAASRQSELKKNYLNRTLERAWIRPGAPALKSAAELLIVENPRVDNETVQSWMENTLDFLSPPGQGVELELHKDNRTWSVVQPENAKKGEISVLKDSIPFIKSGGIVDYVNVRIEFFEVKD